MAYTSSDYSDIFCQAVQNIVNQAVGQLEFDISKECTVIKINNRAYGKYQLSDGSISFEAVATEGATYEVGDQVIATIPRGDYNQQISILNKVVDEWSGPAGWVRPLDTLMRCTGNVAIGASSAALIANGNTSFVNVLDLNNEKFFGFRKIGIVAKFKTLLGGLNVIEGSYGLLMTLKAGGQKHVCDFSESKMLGNPYEFATYFSQEYVFDIPENFNNIDSIQLDFYQKSNFKDGNNNVIDYNENILTLFVDDIEVYFGYDSSRELNSIVEITCDDLAYNLHQSTKDLSLVWFHKINNNVMKQITTEDTSGDNPTYSVRWYQYCPGCKSEGENKETDEYGGDNWKWINKDNPDPMWPTYPFKIIAHMRATRTQERFKAICLVATYPLVNDATYVVYEQYVSNELVFENTEDSTNGGESLSDTIKSEFSLRFRDNSQGFYYIYDQNGDIINLSDGSKDRYVELVYNHGEVWPYQNLTVEWQYPKNNTMILLPSVEEENGLKVFKYSIDTALRDEAINNTIQCLVYIDNILVYTIQEEMQFGKKGSNGTGNTFILDMLDGKNAICLTDSDDEENGTYAGLKVQAILIRESGKRFYFTEEEKSKIAWELIYPCENISLNNSGDIVTLTMTSTIIPDENYTILKASYKYEDSANSPTLEAYLPIPIKSSNNYTYLIGCKQILYNHQGIPKYNDGAYELRTEENVDVSYELVQPTKTVDEKTVIDNPNPVILKDCAGGGCGLSAAALYSKYDNRDETVQDKVCICCKSGENIVWSQPILIMQSRYDFAMLNSWDGGLTIDENNGTILSTMLGAGRKNEQNQFSGVLIGDLQGGTDLNETETMTGVYGLQNGILTYGLRENGSAFFGAYNRGRIEIDGTSGIIRSAGWEKDEGGNWNILPTETLLGLDAGTLLDLDDGMFLLRANQDNYFYFNKNKEGGLEIKTKSSKGDEFSFSTEEGLKITTSGVNIILRDQNNDLSGYIQATAEGLTSAFTTADNDVRSEIVQTAEHLTSVFEKADEGLRSEIEQAAGSVTSTVQKYVDDKLVSYSTISQTEDEIKNAVSGKLDETGTFGSCGWSITTKGFKIYKEVDNKTTNLFTVDTSGNAIFSGQLSAVSGSFKKLTAGAFSLNNKDYYSTFAGDHIDLCAQWKDNSTPQQTVAGKIFIGSPNVLSKYWEDISIIPTPLLEYQDHYIGVTLSYGNVGTEDSPFDLMYARGFINDSTREIKENILTYDNNQAYEELKYFPLYTYTYKTNNNKTKMLKLGSIIDYFPSEVMATKTESNKNYDRDNLTFWAIAATQATQNRVENLITRVEYLEQLVKKEEI